jgi:3-hydroxyacyl-[acyl-carrier-protein] dehydratase
MTRPVFSFDSINRSRDGDTLSCRCVLAADMPCFDGHFPGMPVMPAAAQIGMIQALLQQQADWNAVITGGSGLKFSGRIQPGATLTLRLQRSPCGDIRFSVEHRTTVVSKGVLLTGGTLD